MLRKISTLTFLLTLIMALAACGTGGSEPAADGGANAGGADETPVTDPTAPPVDETPAGTVEPDGGPEVLPPAPDQLLLVGTTWNLVQMSGNLQPVPGAGITMSFDETNIGGSSGCNSYSTTYAASADGAISFNAETMISTMMACSEEIMSVEMAYLDALRTVSAYALDGDTLRLTYADGELTFSAPAPQADAPLAGTAWFLESISQGDAVASALRTTVISLIFADGRLNGSGGCNTFMADYTLDNDGALSIGPAGATRMACEPAIMNQESTLLTALENTERYVIEGDRLTLFQPSGSLIFVAMDAAEIDPAVVRGRVAEALAAKNLDLLGENSTNPVALGFWPEPTQALDQATFLQTLGEDYLVGAANVTLSSDAEDMIAPLGDQNPALYFDGVTKIIEVRFSRGWGADGAGEALLYFVQQYNGLVRLGGILLAPAGFSS
jgi:heat shock protein HslJ